MTRYKAIYNRDVITFEAKDIDEARAIAQKRFILDNERALDMVLHRLNDQGVAVQTFTT